MDSRRVTNFLLLVIAGVLSIHLILSLAGRCALAETFRLDTCVTDKPSEKPGSYLHVVMHGMADTGSAQQE